MRATGKRPLIRSWRRRPSARRGADQEWAIYNPLARPCCPYRASELVDELYDYAEGTVFFKPTLAERTPSAVPNGIRFPTSLGAKVRSLPKGTGDKKSPAE